MEQNIKDILCRAIQQEDPYFKDEFKWLEAKLYSKVFYDELCQRHGIKGNSKTFKTEEVKPI